MGRSLFAKIRAPFQKLKKMFSRNNFVEVHLLDGIDLERLEDEDIQSALRERKVLTQKLYQESKLSLGRVINELTTLQKIIRFPQKVLFELEKCARLYAETMVVMGDFQRKIVQEEEVTPSYIEKYEEQIPRAIRMMKDHEENQRLVRNDLNILEGEKADLEYDFIRFRNIIEWSRRGLIFLVLFVAVAALVIVLLFITQETSVLVPAIFISATTFFIGLWLYIFRRYAIHELKQNQLKQKRAVELINKIRIKYVGNQQVLDFEYKKYQVNSSEVLEMRWDNYQQLLQDKKKFHYISKNMSAIIVDLEDILTTHGINAYDWVTENIDYFATKKGREHLLAHLEEKRSNLAKSLEKMENDLEMLQKLTT